MCQVWVADSLVFWCSPHFVGSGNTCGGDPDEMDRRAGHLGSVSCLNALQLQLMVRLRSTRENGVLILAGVLTSSAVNAPLDNVDLASHESAIVNSVGGSATSLR